MARDDDRVKIARQKVAGLVDALEFALRTVKDPDLTEREVRDRIERVARGTLERANLGSVVR
jgi:hypothetical protein